MSGSSSGIGSTAKNVLTLTANRTWIQMKILRAVADQEVEMGMENHGSGILSGSRVALSSTIGGLRTINDTGMPLVER